MSDKNNYQSLINKLNDWLEDVQTHEIKDLAKGIDFLTDWAKTGLSISQEELENQTSTLKRDLGHFYFDSKNELNESAYYLSIKDKLWHNLVKMTDQTQLEWRELRHEFEHEGIYKTGEQVAIGQLECIKCGNQLTIEHVQFISECSACQHNEFIRKKRHI